MPIKLIYGSNDWSNVNDRNETQKLLGLSDFEIIDNCGHFSFIERPMKVAQIISSKKFCMNIFKIIELTSIKIIL